jgi:hypothetical protein
MRTIYDSPRDLDDDALREVYARIEALRVLVLIMARRGSAAAAEIEGQRRKAARTARHLNDSD